jgi:hypothetical protein
MTNWKIRSLIGWIMPMLNLTDGELFSSQVKHSFGIRIYKFCDKSVILRQMQYRQWQLHMCYGKYTQHICSYGRSYWCSAQSNNKKSIKKSATFNTIDCCVNQHCMGTLSWNVFFLFKMQWSQSLSEDGVARWWHLHIFDRLQRWLHSQKAAAMSQCYWDMVWVLEHETQWW